MELTAASVWEWTKLYVRDPRTAAGLVKSARLSIEVSILMIVLAGVMSGVATGVLQSVFGPTTMMMELPDGRTATIIEGSPITQGLTAVVFGLALSFAIHRIGRMRGGQGTPAEIFSLVAVLQLVLTVIVVGRTIATLVLPIVGLALMLLGIVVFLRGILNSVDVGHEFDSLGRSFGVIALSLLGMFFALFVIVGVLGLEPQGMML